MGTLGSGYRLVASSSGLTSATSAAFSVVSSSGVAVKLKLTLNMIDGQAGQPLGVQPVVEIHDAQNAKVGNAVNSVTIAIKSGTGAEGALLSGVLTVTAVAGTATFSGLAIDKAAVGYKVVVTSSGLASDESNAFTMNGPKDLIFTTQPVGARVNNVFAVAPVVSIRDISNVVMTSRNDFVTLTLKSGTGTSGSSLFGLVRRRLQNGTVAFPNLSVDRAGTGFVIVAATDAEVLGESAAFDIQETAITPPGGNPTSAAAPSALAPLLTLLLTLATAVTMAFGLLM
jgi:hypothetical protein